MEAFERGLLRSSDTDGLDLTWGNVETMLRLVEKIGKREGIGDLLANGVRHVAKQLGGEAYKFAVEVKGLELAYHDPVPSPVWPPPTPPTVGERVTGVTAITWSGTRCQSTASRNPSTATPPSGRGWPPP